MISRVQKVYEVQLIRCIEKMNRVNFMGLVHYRQEERSNATLPHA